MKNAISLREDSNDSNWIVTFADLVTLLLVFFILLFSVSTVKEDSFEDTIDSVKSALTRTEDSSQQGAGKREDDESMKVETGTVPTDIQDTSLETGEKQQAPTQIAQPIITTPFSVMPSLSAQEKKDQERKKQLSQVSDAVQELIARTDTTEQSQLATQNNKIMITINGDLFFNRGSAQFKREAMPVMDGIGNILRKNEQFTLAIGGHTDNTPINTTRYPSNWELSAIRATTVLRYFARGGMALERLTATGYGESAPLVPNNSPEQRAKNRRIDFILERKEP